MSGTSLERLASAAIARHSSMAVAAEGDVAASFEIGSPA
jgi:hypothetical protein